METSEAKLWADQIDYNEETGDALARDNVHIKYFKKGEEIWADQVDYNIQRDTAWFRNVRGTSPARIDSRPGLLTTTNPFYFEGRWAERIKEKVILYHGFVTDCRLPRPWWTLRAGGSTSSRRSAPWPTGPSSGCGFFPVVRARLIQVAGGAAPQERISDPQHRQ